MNHTLAAALLALTPVLTLAGPASGPAPASAPFAVETVAVGGFFSLYDFITATSKPDPGPLDLDEQDEGDGRARPPFIPRVLPPFVPDEPRDDARPGDGVVTVGIDPLPPVIQATALPLPSTLLLTALALGALAALQPRSSRRRILPTGDLGRSPRNSMMRGRL